MSFKPNFSDKSTLQHLETMAMLEIFRVSIPAYEAQLSAATQKIDYLVRWAEEAPQTFPDHAEEMQNHYLHQVEVQREFCRRFARKIETQKRQVERIEAYIRELEECFNRHQAQLALKKEQELVTA